MATEAIIRFLEQHREILRPPILEVGSKLQPSYKQHSLRALHPGKTSDEYVGIDIEPGEDVDLVLDLTERASLDQLGRERFRTIHCHCVLEHVPEVWTFARHLEAALQLGGVLCVSVPFAWRIHRIPVDMWRFTPQSIDYLFPSVEFTPERCSLSTRALDQWPIDEPPELPLGTALQRHSAALRLAIKALRRLHLDDRYFQGQRALLLESNLMFIGEKRPAPTFTFFR